MSTSDRLNNCSKSDKVILEKIRTAAIEAGLSPQMDFEESPVEKSYYVRTEYSVYAEYRVDKKSRQSKYVVEYPEEQDGRFIVYEAAGLVEMLAVLAFTVAVFGDVRKRLDNAL